MKLCFLPLIVVLSSCACWKKDSPEYNSKKCVIARQAVDCTTAAIQGLLPAALAIIGPLIGGSGAIDWDFILSRLTAGGLENGICILSQLQLDFASRALPPEKKLQLASATQYLRERHGMKDIPLKLMVDGKAVLVH